VSHLIVSVLLMIFQRDLITDEQMRAAAAALADLPATAFGPVLPLVRCRNPEDEQSARLSGLTGETPVQI
jgi:hypothetical protein